MDTVIVTGSSGLVGSACVRHFAALGCAVHGLDGGQRKDFFGPDGDTSLTLASLRHDCPNFTHHLGDVRHLPSVLSLVKTLRPDLVIHAAAQPSHDWASSHPLSDFETNAVGTVNLLEAVRQYAPEAAFCFLSTNKVYGDAPNRIRLEELRTRYDYFESGTYANGFDESLPIDQSTHSLFGCSKLAADIYCQEYGRYYGLRTVSFRAGCLTGSAHAAAEQHGFLAYLVRCCREGRPYKVYGYKGKQVRDNLHAADVASACELFWRNPRPGEVYNLGGGRANSISVLEAIDAAEQATGKTLSWEYGADSRKGDHVCYISDCAKLRTHYPAWEVTCSLRSIIEELASGS